ncbi:MAG: disulfide bond formation protein B [Kiloniellaceae bacterium]
MTHSLSTPGSLDALLDRPMLVPALIVAISLSALGTAWAAQVWGGIYPCVLCIYQRYAYGAAMAFGLAGLALGNWPAARRGAVALAGLAFLTGAGIAAFHVGVEQQWWRGTAECHAPSFDFNASATALREQLLNRRFVPCDQVPWSLFGISIAGYNVLASLTFAFASLWAAWRMNRAEGHR